MNLTPRDRVLLVGIAVVLVGFGFFHFGLSPTRSKAASLESQVAAARTSLAQAQRRYEAGRSAAGSLRRTAPSYTAAERAVPRTADIPGLLRILARSARQAHVKMENISLSGAGTAATASTTATPGTATSTGGAAEVPVSLTFAGGYQALNRLVGRLDDLVTVSGDHIRAAGPLVGISNVSLSGAQTGSSLTIAITAVVYQHSAVAAAGTSTPAGSS